MLHSNHYVSIHNLLHSSMSKVYIFQATQTFVTALVGIFIPLYLYSIGVSVLVILLFSIGVQIVKTLLLPVSVQILNHVGFKWTIFSSLPLNILFYYSLAFVPLSINYLFLASFLGGAFFAIFWPAMHGEIAHRSSGNTSKIGNLQVIITLMSAFAPLIGGYFLEFSSYEMILFFSLVLLGLGSIPLLNSQDIALKKIKFSYKTMYSYLFKKKFHDNLPFIGEGIEAVIVLLIAPILFFIWLKGNFASIGAILSAFAYLSIIFILFFNQFAKRKSKRKIVKVIANITGIQWLFRAVAYTIGGVVVLIIEGAYKMIQKAFYVTYFSLFYENKKRGTELEMFDKIMQREVVLGITRICFCSIVICLFYFLGESTELLITIITLGLFGSILKGFIADLNRY